MTPELLTEVGEALYGNQWRSALAADLKVSERTMRRWANGIFAMPPTLREELLDVVREHGAALAVIQRKLNG